MMTRDELLVLISATEMKMRQQERAMAAEATVAELRSGELEWQDYTTQLEATIERQAAELEHWREQANVWDSTEDKLKATIERLTALLRVASHYLTDVYLQQGDQYHGGLGAFRNDIDAALDPSAAAPPPAQSETGTEHG